MSRGFVRGPLDVRLLLLYILARLTLPIDRDHLLDLALCDEGMDYFQFTEALTSLINTGHVQEDENRLLTITQKGRANGSVCEDELAYSVRLKCDRSAAEMNKILQRQNQVRSSILPRSDGGVTVRMALDDDTGNLMTLEMLAPDQKEGEHLAAAFQDRPDLLYNTLLSVLLDGAKDG
ncbi:MAG: DUF4364 family protein [Clostridiales bacterium]|nr:DUF4364 family protein [Clostridiales bacterium]